MIFQPVSIRVNILTYFLIIVGIVTVSLLGIQYYFSQKLAVEAAEASFSHTVEKVAQHIDADLFKLFLTSGVYLEYAREHLRPEQIDEVVIEDYLT